MTGGPGPRSRPPQPGDHAPARRRVPARDRTPARRRVPVFVCGDPSRGDDAAGLAAVELLPPDVRARADVVMAGQLDVLLLLDLPADAPCVLVDAVAGLPPGEIWVRPLVALVDRARGLADAGRAPEPRSSHELPLDQVLALAATLRARPPAGTFVGISGSCWDLGAPLSPAVAVALPAFAAAIATAVVAAAGAAAVGAEEAGAGAEEAGAGAGGAAGGGAAVEEAADRSG
jgi:hydrogenase maturation protease